MTGPESAGGGIDPRFARSARRWLAAYPADWRAQRDDEIASLLADLAGPGARRVELRAGLPLLWNGLATRRRLGPPLRVLLEYRLLNHPVPARYRAWVRADLERPWRPVRELPWRLLGLAPLLWLLGAGAIGSVVQGLVTAAYLCVVVGVDCALGARRRRTVAERHLLPGPGEPREAGAVRRATVPRDRAPAGPAAARFVRSLVVLGVGASVTLVVALARGGGAAAELLAAVGGLAVGGALVPLVRRRRRHLADPPPQPGRRVVPTDPAAALAGPLLAAALVLVSLALVAGGDRGGVVGAGLLAAVLVLLPPAVSTRRWAADRADLALVDVLRALVRGRPPVVDQPVPGFVPVEPPAAPAPSP